MTVMLVSSWGVCFRDEHYSYSHSRLYQDFLCFSMMYMCIKSLLPNNFLTFNLWMSSTRSVVGRCISLLFCIIWVFTHLISNTSHIQFFFRVTLCDDSSPINLNKCVFPADWFKFRETYDMVSAKNSFILHHVRKGLSPKEYALFNLS